MTETSARLALTAAAMHTTLTVPFMTGICYHPSPSRARVVQSSAEPERGPRVKKLFTVLASTLLTLVIAECALRVIFAIQGKDIKAYRIFRPGSETSRFVSHPFLPYAQRPNDSRTLRTPAPDGTLIPNDYHTNSLGFRAPETPFDKPEGVKRIVCLGGSTTFGGERDAETWPAMLEARLHARGVNAEVVNLGVDMAASPTSLINLELVGLRYRPDLIISYDGVNDSLLIGKAGITPDYRNALGRLDESFMPWQARVPGWILERSYLVTWATFLHDRGRADLVSQVMKVYELPESKDPLEGVEYFERNLKLMRAASREYGAKFLAATAHWASPPEKIRRLNDELRRFYAREGIDYIDLASLPPSDKPLHWDDVHFTKEGMNRIAEAYERKIIEGELLK